MSLFRNSDYKQKKQTIYSKKTRLPTQSKTIKHRCSQCERMDAKKYPIGEKEVRWLCPLHFAYHNRSGIKESAFFLKASTI